MTPDPLPAEAKQTEIIKEFESVPRTFNARAAGSIPAPVTLINSRFPLKYQRTLTTNRQKPQPGDAAHSPLSLISTPASLPQDTEAPPLRIAIGFALIAAASAAFVSVMLQIAQDPWSDFSQVVMGARAVRDGLNPYVALSSHPLARPLVYPLPAALLALPLSWSSMPAADACFVALGVGLLAYAHARTGQIERPAVLVFLSAALVQTVITAQWPALLLGAILLCNGLLSGAVLAGKPTTAIWLLAAHPSWRAVLGALAVYVISLAVRPMWPLEWWTVVTRPDNFSPVVLATLPFGLLIVLAAAWRWRRPEARLLLAMCCVPHTTFVYETLPLLAMVPKTWIEGRILCAASWICWVGYTATVLNTTTLSGATHIGGLWSLACLYVPCAIMLLRRPNEWPERSLNERPA